MESRSGMAGGCSHEAGYRPLPGAYTPEALPMALPVALPLPRTRIALPFARGCLWRAPAAREQLDIPTCPVTRTPLALSKSENSNRGWSPLS